MSRRSKNPVPPSTLQSDRAILVALQSLSEYAPRNPICAPASLLLLEAETQRAEQAVRDAQQALAEARERLLSASWAFHDATLLAKAEVVVQFGDDSFAVQAVGLTPRSERKRPVRRKVAAAD